MRFTLRNDPDEIGRIPGLLNDFATQNEIPASTTARLNLILEELVTNVISYGFDGGECERIEIDLKKESDSVHFRFLDNGKPYNPLETGSPDITLGLDDRTPGGLGIHLIREMSDQITYKFSDGWNQLQIQLSHLET